MDKINVPLLLRAGKAGRIGVYVVAWIGGDAPRIDALQSIVFTNRCATDDVGTGQVFILAGKMKIEITPVVTTMNMNLQL